MVSRIRIRCRKCGNLGLDDVIVTSDGVSFYYCQHCHHKEEVQYYNHENSGDMFDALRYAVMNMWPEMWPANTEIKLSKEDLNWIETWLNKKEKTDG